MDSADPLPTSPTALRRALLAFFDRSARDLPWRRTGDPYAIWVSEIMLQQTRVETVIPYYRDWLRRFPTVEALAEADESEVLKAWEGLGYYRRARNLHRGARVVRERFQGRLPGDSAALREIPGIGPYTAGAVASIAFGEAAPAVDGNVRRVLSRLFDLPAPSDTELRQLAGALVDPDRPGDFNQALMELGATVCTPRAPECGACPVASSCLALGRGTVAERPPARKRAPVPREVHAVAVLVSGPADALRLLVRQRPAEGLLAGLWEFPGRLLDQAAGETEERAVRRLLGETLAGATFEGVPDDPGGAALAAARPLDEVRHAFSHLHVTYRPYVIHAAGGERRPMPPERRWVAPHELEELALPVAMQRIAALALAALGID